MRDSQRLLRTIRSKRRRGVGTGLAPVEKITYYIKSTDNRKGCPYGCAWIFVSQSLRVASRQPTSLYTREAEQTVVRECEFNIPHGRAVACCRRGNLRKYSCYRLLSNRIQYRAVGTALAAVRQRLPLTRELAFFFWKMTEGETTKVKYLLLSLLPSRLRRATFLVRGRPYSTSIFIWYLICNWLRTGASPVPTDCVNILISYQPKIIIFQQQSNGGSKPPPYTVKLNFRIYIRLLSDLKI